MNYKLEAKSSDLSSLTFFKSTLSFPCSKTFPCTFQAPTEAAAGK